jgi:hypothetical protein
MPKLVTFPTRARLDAVELRLITHAYDVQGRPTAEQVAGPIRLWLAAHPGLERAIAEVLRGPRPDSDSDA